MEPAHEHCRDCGSEFQHRVTHRSDRGMAFDWVPQRAPGLAAELPRSRTHEPAAEGCPACGAALDPGAPGCAGCGPSFADE